ncbi:hypothetical protein GCM10019016_074490 [Streptomyces prasinosporus]|uniref:Uncharacterized protein n=1 Tax=Streptomyces prasinosporus TaxID=68256 RepID=A0ABP6TY89_9ACTN
MNTTRMGARGKKRREKGRDAEKATLREGLVTLRPDRWGPFLLRRAGGQLAGRRRSPIGIGRCV